MSRLLYVSEELIQSRPEELQILRSVDKSSRIRNIEIWYEIFNMD